MANRPNNIWAKAAAGSPGTNIARAQQSRWTGIPNEAITRLVEDKIGGMLEGISDATERNAAAQIRLALQKKLQAVAAKHGSLAKEDFRLEMVKLAVEAGLTLAASPDATFMKVQLADRILPYLQQGGDLRRSAAEQV